MDGSQNTPPFLETDQGAGLLSGRALWASLVGPQRLAMAARKVVGLNNSQAKEIYKSLGASGGYVLVGVALPYNAPVNPLSVVFGTDDQLGFNTGWPVRLTDTSQGQFLFTQLLQPGEQLFCQIMDTAVAEQNVVVSAAIF
jgi:hypothetical protein